MVLNRKKIQSEAGMTLVEIIVAMTVLGIIIASTLNMFGFGISEIFSSGNRTDVAYSLQELADDLQEEHRNNPFTTAELATFMESKGYKEVGALADLSVQQTGYDGNYYLNSTTIESVDGGEVTIQGFYKNGARTAQITTFLIGDDLT